MNSVAIYFIVLTTYFTRICLIVESDNFVMAYLTQFDFTKDTCIKDVLVVV